MHALVEPQVFSALDEQVIVLLVAAVNGDLFGSSHGAEHEAHLLKAGNLDVLLNLWLLIELLALTLTRDLNEDAILVELAAVVLVHPLRVFRQQLITRKQPSCIHLAA